MPVCRSLAFLLALAAGALPLAGAAVAGEVKLVSHRAVYELSLGRADPSGGIAGLRGRLVLEFNACDGYTLNQRIRTEMTSSEGREMASDFSVSSWESDDGNRFRFAMRNESNGEVVEEFVGEAARQPNGQGGQAQFTKPEQDALDLPRGTVFPTEHLRKLIEAAQAGRSFLEVRVFDGSGEEGLFETGGHIGREITGDEAGRKPLPEGLGAVPSWPVRIGYFPLFSRAEMPQYELGFRLFANGVTGNLVLDYGDFAMHGELDQLVLMPGC